MRFFLPLVLALMSTTPAMARNHQTANIPPNPVTSQELSSLNARRTSLQDKRNSLTEKQDFWHDWTIWLGAIAGGLGILAGAAAFMESKRSYAQRGVDSQLSETDAKIAEWKKNDSDWRIARTDAVNAQLGIDLQDAAARTAEIQKEAADALLHLNQQLAQVIRPRRITMVERGDGKTSDRVERQKRFADLKKYPGTPAIIQSVSGPEPETLAGDIWTLLHNAGWSPVILREAQSHISSGLIRPGVRIATLEKPWGFKPNKGDKPAEFLKPDPSPSNHAAVSLFSALSLDLGPPYETAAFSLSIEPEYKKWGAESPYPGEDVPNMPAVLIDHGFDFPDGAVVILVGSKSTEYSQSRLPKLLGPPVP